MLISHGLELYYKRSLPTFVVDQCALQRISSCKLAQPQFPVHLFTWYPKNLSCPGLKALTSQVNVL